MSLGTTDLAHAATEQIRAQAGRNVITVVDARFAELLSCIDAQNSRIDALIERIATLQKVLWPLVISLCVTLLSAVGGGLFVLFGN